MLNRSTAQILAETQTEAAIPSVAFSPNLLAIPSRASKLAAANNNQPVILRQTHKTFAAFSPEFLSGICAST